MRELPWGTHQGAVSLTFDDGTQNQLQMAVPELDKRDLRATFYLYPSSPTWREELAPWSEVATRGHEIGNHTLWHLCPGSLEGVRHGLEEMTPEEMEEEILEAQARLEQLAPNQKEWTFCYPCYNTDVGKGENRRSYAPIISKHFVAGRSGGEYGTANNPRAVDLATVRGLATDRMSGYEMIGLCEELTARGLWVVLVFHEISGHRLTVGSHDFNMLLDHLKRHRDRIWTAPMVEVAEKIRAFQTGPGNA